MLERLDRNAPIVFCTGFAAFGVWSLATAEYATGSLYLSLSVAWLLGWP